MAPRRIYDLIKEATITDANTPVDDTGIVGVLLGHLANRIRAITGLGDWKGVPPTTLQAASDHHGLTTSAHGGIVAATDSRLSDARTPTAHDHDDRYYTEAEINSALDGKSNTGHDHAGIEVSYSNTGSGLAATNTQAAIDEVAGSAGVGAATETTAGIVELATDTELQAGDPGVLVATAERLKTELDRRATKEAWITPTLQNGWTNLGGGNATAGYYKHDGRVYIKGTVTGGTVPSAVFTLPAGYRPLETYIYGAAAAASAYARINLQADGQVIVQQGSTTWTALGNISFRAEQ